MIVSFIIAGIASFLAGLSYAELGARVPRSGSAYVYIYVTIGEFIAFIIGWDVILEYIIGTSSTASALRWSFDSYDVKFFWSILNESGFFFFYFCSSYIDNMCNNTISNALSSAMHMEITGLGPYPDFLAFGLSIAVTSNKYNYTFESHYCNRSINFNFFTIRIYVRFQFYLSWA